MVRGGCCAPDPIRPYEDSTNTAQHTKHTHTAGLQHVARLEEFPHEKWALLVQVMLTGVADLTRGVLPMMRKQGYGRIVNIGSIHR